MKKKQIVWMSVLLVLFMALALSASFVITQGLQSNGKKEVDTVKTFAEWTDDELFAKIPAMETKGVKVGGVRDAGAKNYILEINGADKKAYEDYLTLLQNEGYEILVDNGEEGIDGAVFTTNLRKDDIDLAVVHMKKLDLTYVIATEERFVSKYLTYDEDAVKNLDPNAKTKLHMPELYDFGNSFVFELKNGHFIVNDGGTDVDLIYLIEYLESLVPEGEKPIIDCWVISHAHWDHCGVFLDLLAHPAWGDRFYVEELMFSEPNMQVLIEWNTSERVRNIEYARHALKTTEGKKTPIVRPIMGQKYYYCDVEMEVMLSQEFLDPEDYSEDFNDSSTWLMYNLDGQKALLGGDGDFSGMQIIMRTYDSSYFKLDVFTNLHHAINVFDVFTDFCEFKTVLVPFYDNYGDYPKVLVNGTKKMAEITVKANEHLKAASDELMTGYGGTLVLTFPYVVGTAERLAPNTWAHHGGVKKESQYARWYRIYTENGYTE